MQAFADLVGTAIVPAHCFDTDELTDLTPALDTATDVHDMTEPASEANASPASVCGPPWHCLFAASGFLDLCLVEGRD